MKDIGIKNYSKNIVREIEDGNAYIDIFNDNIILNISLIDELGINLIFNYKDKNINELGKGGHINLYKRLDINKLEVINPDSSLEKYKIGEENKISKYKLLFDNDEYVLTNKIITYYSKDNGIYPYKIKSSGKEIIIDNNNIKFDKYDIELSINEGLIEKIVYKLGEKILGYTTIEYKNGYINKIIKRINIENAINKDKIIELNICSDYIEIKNLDTLNGERYNIEKEKVINIERICNTFVKKEIEFNYYPLNYYVNIKNNMNEEINSYYNRRIINYEVAYFSSVDKYKNIINEKDYNELNYKENFSDLTINSDEEFINLNYSKKEDSLLKYANYIENNNFKFRTKIDKNGLEKEPLLISLTVRSDEISSYSNLTISLTTYYKDKEMDKIDDIVIKNDFIGYRTYSKGIICKNSYDYIIIEIKGSLKGTIGNIYLSKNYAKYYYYKNLELNHVIDLTLNKEYDVDKKEFDLTENLNDLYNYFDIFEYQLSDIEKEQIGYDKNNKVKRYIKTVDNEYISEEYEYDNNDILLSEKNNLGIVNKYEYDSFKNLKKIINSLGNTIEYVYKDYQDLLSIIYKYKDSDKENKIEYKYDRGRISEVIISSSTKYNFIYEDDNLTKILLNEMTIFRFEYDEFGQIIKQYLGSSDNYYYFIYKNNNIEEIKYIELNNVKETYQFEYDNLDRITIVKKNNNEILVNNKYDIRGNLVHVSNSYKNIEYFIDNNELKRKNILINDLKKIKTFQEYNSLQRSQSNDIKTFSEDIHKINKYNFAIYYKNYDIDGNKNYRGYVKCEELYQDYDKLYKKSLEDFKYRLKNNPMDYIDGGNHVYYKIDNKKDTLNFSISMWFKQKNTNYNPNDYLFSIVEGSHHIHDKKVICLKNQGGYLSLFLSDENVLWIDELIKENDWNYFAMSFRYNDNNIEVNINLNGTIISEIINDKNYLIKEYINKNLELNIGFIKEGEQYYVCNSYITLLSFDANTILDNNSFNELYNIGFDYIENNKNNYFDKNQEVNIVDFSQVHTVKLSDYTTSEYKIFLLNNSLNSINYNTIDDNKYDKPVFVKHRKLETSDTDPIFNYNKELNRYAYVARNNILEYETNIYESGMLGARFYFEGSNKEEYLLDAKDKNNNEIALYKTLDKKLILKYNNMIFDSNIELTNNKWYDIGISFDANIVGGSLGSAKRRIFKLVVGNILKNFYIEDINVISNLRICLGNKLLDNKLELENNSMMGLISDFVYSTSFQFEAYIHSLFKELNGIIYTKEYDKCERISKKTVSLYQKDILKNKYYYDARNNKLTTNIILEKINDIERKYSYDEFGNIIKIEDKYFKNKEYKYNSRGYLIEEKEDNNIIKYQYDEYGNLINYNYNNQNQIFRYKANNRYLLLMVNRKRVTYSKDNTNLEQFGNKKFKYNGRRLVEIEIKNSDSQEKIRFEYNHLGLRTKKEYIKIDSNGLEEVKTYIYEYDNDKLIYESDGNISNYYLYDELDNIYGFIQNKNYYFYLRDSLGNILGLVDSSGNIVVKYSYNAYGQNMSEEGNIYNPIRYKGYYYDIETNMYYCKSRYYVPELFRWLSMDSINYLDIESISGNNLYMYCNNNPVMYSDINGNFWDTVFDVGFIAWDILNLIKNEGGRVGRIGLH